MANREIKVVLYVLDGCQVRALESLETPEAKELRRRARIYLDAQTIYPSLTGPGHASILTGVRPGAHGLVSHMFWEWGSGVKNIYSDAAFESPTVFELLSRRGFRAQGHANYFRRGLSDPPLRRALKWVASRVEGSAAISSLVDSLPPIERFLKRGVAGTLEGVDQKVVESSEPLHYVVDNHVDKASHKYGPTSTEYSRSLERALANILSLTNRLDSAGQEYTLIVTSDHGHTDVEHKLDADALDLSDVGYTIRDTKILNANLVVEYGTPSETTAVSVVVSRHLQLYVKDKSKVGRLRSALAAKPFMDRVLVGGEIVELGVWNARTGDIIGGLKENVGFAELPIGLRGDHGGFCEDEMRVPLWLIGTRIRPGAVRGGDTVSIAPTICTLLGVGRDGAGFHGEPLNL